MIKTRGLTHIHLVVKDLRRSLDFYKSVFGMQEKFWAGDSLVFLNTPGSNDLITLHQIGGRPAGRIQRRHPSFWFPTGEQQRTR